MRLDEEIADWAEAKWPGAPISRKCRKLGEEIGELHEALMSYYADPCEDNRRHALSEAGDVGCVLSHIVVLLGGFGLQEEMERVFSLRKVREETDGD